MMMNDWVAEAMRHCNWALGNPTTTLQFAVVGIVAVIAFLFVLTKVSDYLGAPVSSMGRSSVVLLLTVVGWLAATAAANMYIQAPSIRQWAQWFPIVVMVLVVLLVSAPLMYVTHKAKYGKALALMLITIGVVFGIILVINQGFSTARQGGKEGDVIKGRTEEMNDFLSK